MLPGFFCMLSVQLPPCSAGSLLLCFRRFSFAVCFSRRFKRFRGKASSSVDFSPFHLLYQSSIRLLKQTAKENLRHKTLPCLFAHP